MKDLVKSWLLKKLIKKLPIIEVCKEFSDYSNYLPDKLKSVIQSLCEEGYFEIPGELFIEFSAGSFKVGRTNGDDLVVIHTIEELEEVLKEFFKNSPS